MESKQNVRVICPLMTHDAHASSGGTATDASVGAMRSSYRLKQEACLLGKTKRNASWSVRESQQVFDVFKASSTDCSEQPKVNATRAHLSRTVNSFVLIAKTKVLYFNMIYSLGWLPQKHKPWGPIGSSVGKSGRPLGAAHGVSHVIAPCNLQIRGSSGQPIGASPCMSREKLGDHRPKRFLVMQPAHFVMDNGSYNRRSHMKFRFKSFYCAKCHQIQ